MMTLMRGPRGALWMIPLAVALAGCGEGRLIVNVDALSFLDATERVQPYGPIAAGLSGSTETPPFGMQMPEGVGGSTIVDSVIITGAAEFANQTGSADVSFELFFHDDSATLYTTTPAISVSTMLEPATTDTLVFTEPVPQALLDVFNGATVYTGVRILYQSTDPIGDPDLQGVATVLEFVARIVMSEDVF